MSVEGRQRSTAEKLRETRTYGKFRCHNPSCMGRFAPAAGERQVKCPECGMEFRVHWLRPDFPRIRGPVWDVNRKIAEEALRRKMEASGSAGSFGGDAGGSEARSAGHPPRKTEGR